MSNTKVQAINFPEAKALKDAFEFYESSEKTVYNSKPRIFKENGYTFTSTNDVLKELQKFGVSEDLSVKEAQFILEKWYNDLLKNQAETITEVPRSTGPEATTLTSDQFKNFDKDIERQKKSEQIRENQKEETERFKKRGEEIFAEQQRIQSEIKAAEAAKVKLAGKVLYAKVILPEPLPLDEIEQGELEVLRSKAIKEIPEPGKTISPKVELINDLTIQIEEKIRPSLPNAPEEQIELIARTAAVEIVEKIAKPEVAISLNIQAAILTSMSEDKQQVVATVVKQDDELLTAAKNGSTLSALKIRNDELTSKLLIENLFGPKLGAVINGYSPEQIKVELTETKIDGQSEYQIDLRRLQETQIQILQNQDKVLSTIQEHGQKFGYDSIGGTFTNYARTYLAEKTAAMPAGSFVKKVYSDPIVQSILAKYGLANSVVWETTAQSGQFVTFLMKVSPDTAGPILNIAGRLSGNEYVTGIVSLSGGAIGANIAKQAASTYTSIAATDIMAAEAFAGGAGTAASQVAVKTGFAGFIAKIAAFLGAPAGPVGFAISSAISALVVEIGKRINWPAIKKWFQDNKEVFVGLAAGGGLLVGGPVVGGVMLFGGLAATGTLGAFATGAFGVLGFIGRSIGTAIATPVIVTLLIIPPLVAFIMLVINNSAYVVPPGLSSSARNGGADNPYMLVTKTAHPSKLDNSQSNQTVIYTVSVKAIKTTLTNLKIVSSECNVMKKDKSIVKCPGEFFTEIKPSTGISPTRDYVFSFTGIYDQKYNDSLIYDSITFSAEAEGKTIETSGSASVCIGDCPNDCPSIWPTSHGYITQGARTPNGMSHNTLEAIDIGVSYVGVYATHTGVVVKAEKNSCYGNRIWIKSSCNGKDFITQYGHLEGIGIKNGQAVTMGQTIGVSGNTGTCTTGPHLHYEFRYYPNGIPIWPNNPPFMMKPFVPIDIKRGCKTTAECGVSF